MYILLSARQLDRKDYIAAWEVLWWEEGVGIREVGDALGVWVKWQIEFDDLANFIKEEAILPAGTPTRVPLARI